MAEDNSYLTDYAFHSSLFGFVETGTAAVTLPSTDQDGNGIIDFLQFNRGVNAAIGGSIFPDGSDREAFSGVFTRIPGISGGRYLLTLTGGGERSGAWTVGSILGTAEYIRREQNMIV